MVPDESNVDPSLLHNNNKKRSMNIKLLVNLKSTETISYITGYYKDKQDRLPTSKEIDNIREILRDTKQLIPLIFDNELIKL